MQKFKLSDLDFLAMGEVKSLSYFERGVARANKIIQSGSIVFIADPVTAKTYDIENQEQLVDLINTIPREHWEYLIIEIID